jgi:hypothetical protein
MQETPPIGGVFRFSGIVIFLLTALDEKLWKYFNGHVRKNSMVPFGKFSKDLLLRPHSIHLYDTRPFFFRR